MTCWHNEAEHGKPMNGLEKNCWQGAERPVNPGAAKLRKERIGMEKLAWPRITRPTIAMRSNAPLAGTSKVKLSAVSCSKER